MPTIRTRCPTCRQHVTFAAGRCALLSGPDGNSVAYAFVCPDCGEPIVRPADERITEMLLAGGVSQHGVEEQPGRLPHPEEPRPGPPLTRDDLLDFHLLLASADSFEGCCRKQEQQSRRDG